MIQNGTFIIIIIFFICLQVVEPDCRSIQSDSKSVARSSLSIGELFDNRLRSSVHDGSPQVSLVLKGQSEDMYFLKVSKLKMYGNVTFCMCAGVLRNFLILNFPVLFCYL
jgi:hypothetical protein